MGYRKAIYPAVFSFLLTLAFFSCSIDEQKEVVLMKIRSLTPLENNESVAVILEQAQGQGFLTLVVDRTQALSIYMGQQRMEHERPLTHDLMASLLTSVDADIRRVVISDLNAHTYFAEIQLKSQKDELKIDARPSDAIALALRLNTPIFANQSLLEELPNVDDSENLISQVRINSWGFTVQEVSGALKNHFQGYTGVLVSKTQNDSPASMGGMLPGDLILSVDGEMVTSLRRFSEIMAGRQGVNQLEIEFLRDQNTQKALLTRSS